MEVEANVFPNELSKKQILENYFDRMSAPKPMKFTKASEWLNRKAVLKEQLLECLGLSPMPERIPLNPIITGKLDREDYTVERVYFQSWPKIYASGYLYMPKNADFPAPAILCPHGHWQDGAINPVVQSRCIAFAKKGYIALAVDSVHVTDFLIGVCSIGVMTWNNIRALDYLCSLPEVDKERIGCTGASGGGQQTMYVAAIDERIEAAGIVCLVSYFKKILFSDERTHCICNHVPNLMHYTDEPEISAMIAPRPTLYLCVTGDWTSQFPEEEYPEIKNVYLLLGASDKIDCQQYDCGHDYNQQMRERVYAWFNKWLKGIDDPEEAKEPEIQTEALNTLKALSKPIPGARDWEAVIEEYRARFSFTPPNLKTATEWADYQVKFREELKKLLGEVAETPLKPSVICIEENKNYTLEKLTFETEPDIPIPGLLFIPKSVQSPAPAVIVVHPQGKAKLLPTKSALISQLLENRQIVFAIDTRLRGELKFNWFLNTVIWGRPEVGMAVHDIQRAVDYLRARSDVDETKIDCIGFGEAGLWACIAGGLDSRIRAVTCDDIGIAYKNGRSDNIIPHILRYGDLAQIAALMAPRTLFLNVPSNDENFAFVREAYQALSASENLKLTSYTIGQAKVQLPISILNQRNNIFTGGNKMTYYAYISIAGENKISIFKMNPDTGKLLFQNDVALSGGPGPLAVDPEFKFLYAGIRSNHEISSFRIDHNTGGLSNIGTVSLEADPCYIITDRKGNFLLSAYYGAGKVAVNSIGKDGAVGSPAIEWLSTAEHAHCVQTDASNKFAFVPHTVEPNAIFQFKFDENTGKLTPNDIPKAIPEEKIGPRHFCFHPNKDLLFSSNEQGSSVTAYNFDTSTGTLSPFQTISTLPEDYDGENTCAQIHITPSGEFLYVSNRGHDSIAGFSIDDATGQLSSLGQQPTEPTPRVFNIDPTGNFLFAGGQGSGKLASYRIDSQTGELKPLEIYTVGKNPMWVLIIPVQG